MADSRFGNIIDKLTKLWDYCAHGVWSDTRPKFYVSIIKTLNITVRSFLSADIQSQACAMTYRTMLAVVPALALLFAIGRGFGFQNLLQDELYNIFPSQKAAVDHALAFVDTYLNQASEGIFIGIGIVFLLFTLISLMMNMENCFNIIWNVREGRSIWRMLTDYTAMLLILPLLMICAGGFSIFLNSTLQRFLDITFLTPIISFLFELGSFVFTCLFFSAVLILFPNTKVNIKNALLAGLFTGIGFTILQWLFVTGQIYVSHYNAIYGSFSFLPLFLLWLQLVWVIVLSGGLICYASQNIFQYSFTDQISDISKDYKEKVTFAIMAVIVQRFLEHKEPITTSEITALYGIPSRLASNITDNLIDAKLVSKVVIDERHQVYGLQPGVDPNLITINYVRVQLNEMGSHNFIPNFNENFPGIIKVIDNINAVLIDETKDVKLSEIKISKIKKTPKS